MESGYLSSQRQRQRKQLVRDPSTWAYAGGKTKGSRGKIRHSPIDCLQGKRRGRSPRNAWTRNSTTTWSISSRLWRWVLVKSSLRWMAVLGSYLLWIHHLSHKLKVEILRLNRIARESWVCKTGKLMISQGKTAPSWINNRKLIWQELAVKGAVLLTSVLRTPRLLLTKLPHRCRLPKIRQSLTLLWLRHQNSINSQLTERASLVEKRRQSRVPLLLVVTPWESHRRDSLRRSTRKKMINNDNTDKH